MPSSQTLIPVCNPISSDAGRPSPHTCAYLIASDTDGKFSTSYLRHASSPQIPANQALTLLLNLPVETLRDPGLLPSDTNRLQTPYLCLLSPQTLTDPEPHTCASPVSSDTDRASYLSYSVSSEIGRPAPHSCAHLVSLIKDRPINSCLSNLSFKLVTDPEPHPFTYHLLRH